MKKILIVEDDHDIAAALAMRLKAQQYDVEVAYDAVLAMQALAQHKPDVLLLDISIPAGSGFTIVERMQGNPKFIDCPVIFMTASKRSELRKKAHDMGARYFFEKPFDSKELSSAIAECVA